METREVIKDINAQKNRVQNPNSVPLAPVYSPNPSSMSRVGSELRELGDAFSGLGGIIADYDKSKREEGEVEGEILRRQGKSLEEAKAAGDYVGTGWQIADIQIRGDELLMQEQQRIETEAYDLEPEQYREHLQTLTNELLNLPVEEPILKKHINARVKDMAGRLAEQQMKANMEYNYQKTLQSVPRMINSALGAAQTEEDYAEARISVQDMMNPKHWKLKPEDFDNMMKGVVTYRMNEFGDEHIMNLYANAMEEDSPETASMLRLAANVGDPAFAQALAMTESSDRNVHDDGTLVEGPIVLNEDGSPRMYKGKEDRARGRYQTMRSTFHDPNTRAMLGLSGEGNFDDPAQVEEFGKKYLDFNTIRQKGIPELIAASHVSGHNFVDNWVKKIGLDPRKGEISPMEFLQIAGANSTSETGKRAYKERWDYVQKVMGNYDKRRPDSAKELVRLSTKSRINAPGFSELNNAYTKMQERKVNKYMVDDAIRNDTIQNLPDDSMRQEALGTMYMQLRQQVIEQNPPMPNETEENYAKRIEGQHFKAYAPRLYKTGQVDAKLKEHLSNSLSMANVQQGDKINPLATEALIELATLRDNSSESYAKNYIGDEGLAFRALGYLSSGHEPTEALRRAVAVQQKVDSGVTMPTVSREVVKKAINTMVDKATYGFWEKLIPDLFQQNPHADTDESSMLAADFAAGFGGMNGDLMKHEIETRANMYMPDIQNAEGAVMKAFAEVQPRTQIAFGQPLMLDSKSWAEFLGMSEDALNANQNSFHQAMVEELAAQADYPWYEGIKYDLQSAADSTWRLVQRARRSIANQLPEGLAEEKRAAADNMTFFNPKNDMGYFGRAYSTYWGEGNDARTNKRGVPNYKNIRVLVNEEEGTISLNVYGKDGNLLADNDLRISAARIADRIKEINLR